MSWGGARTGAGRPARGPVPSERHVRRPRIAPAHPVHVTARLHPALRAVSRARVYPALRRALAVSLARADFRIVKIAVHANRVELVVEAHDAIALARGMQGFEVSAARALNRAAHRRGNVFPDRYRMRVLATLAAVRAVLGLPGGRSESRPTGDHFGGRFQSPENVSTVETVPRARAGPRTRPPPASRTSSVA